MLQLVDLASDFTTKVRPYSNVFKIIGYNLV